MSSSKYTLILRSLLPQFLDLSIPERKELKRSVGVYLRKQCNESFEKDCVQADPKVGSTYVIPEKLLLGFIEWAATELVRFAETEGAIDKDGHYKQSTARVSAKVPITGSSIW
ncbi:hypothetical protein BDR26DRAFT_901123 [Obelidium mucronatum]|nr:hypothetical protein BDR26DRAFT_901123 [Obelidium mucronatum]